MLIHAGFPPAHPGLGPKNREPAAHPRVSNGHCARPWRQSYYRRVDQAADQKIGLDRVGPDVEREMLLQRLRIERFAGLTPAHPGLCPKNREVGPHPLVSNGPCARRGPPSQYRGEGQAGDRQIGLDRAGPDLEREMLSQRLRIEWFGGLRIGYHATNMLLRDAPPGQFSDHIALRGIRHASFSPAAAGHSRHEFSLLEMGPLRRYLSTMLIYTTLLL